MAAIKDRSSTVREGLPLTVLTVLAPLPRLALLLVFALLPAVGLIAGPAYAALLFGLAAATTLTSLAARRMPRLDRPLALLALVFLALSTMGIWWSIVPAISESRTRQMALILLGCLLLLALPRPDPSTAVRLFTLLLWSSALGTLILAADSLLGYGLQRWLTHGAVNAASKYNRGAIALLLLGWPALAHFHAADQRRRVAALALLLVVIMVCGQSSTGLLALLVGALVWGLARPAPGLTAALLGGGMAALALTLPFALQGLSGWRSQLAGRIKNSGLHRLEIWDYMSARVLERPWTGWGLGSANRVPIDAVQLAHYRYVSPDGVYPHSQWLELWLESGLPGVLLGLALLLLALRRCHGSPFALAAVASALVVSLLNFEITTDSWWAALAASGLLFRFQQTAQN